MKKLIITLSLFSLLVFGGCTKSFLDVRSYDDLVGNEFWKDRNDVEMYMQGLYYDFRATTTSSIFLAATGDFRAAPVEFAHPSLPDDLKAYKMFSLLRTNDLDEIYNYYNISEYDYLPAFPHRDFARFDLVKRWSGFYQIIQKANIAVVEINKEGGPDLSERERKQYTAEAVFVRNLCYFFLVRVFGDVPYYTEAYCDKVIGRTNMLEVLANIDKDMSEYYKDLPWTYSNNAQVGSRAQRGGAIALMMHTNMWLAGFSESKKDEYYQRTITLGDELLNENQNAYGLVNIDNIETVFQGRSKEGLFEITQNSNFSGEVFNRALTFAQMVKSRRVSSTAQIFYSIVKYDIGYMNKLYPLNEPDKRKGLWFNGDMDPSIPNNPTFFDCKKFHTKAQLAINDLVPNNNQIVFRLPDCILLQAEAYANLDQPGPAYEKLMVIRNRAQASALNSSMSLDELKDAIWFERSRELFGESHYFFDLVRTKKATNPAYTTNPILSSDFAKGAWTWPIDRSALLNNPEMVLNTFWNN